jgi:hypothetical protein
MDQRQRHPLAADAEVLQRSLRLRAPKPVGGDGDLAETIGFDAGSAHDSALAKAGATGRMFPMFALAMAVSGPAPGESPARRVRSLE